MDMMIGTDQVEAMSKSQPLKLISLCLNVSVSKSVYQLAKKNGSLFFQHSKYFIVLDSTLLIQLSKLVSVEKCKLTRYDTSILYIHLVHTVAKYIKYIASDM